MRRPSLVSRLMPCLLAATVLAARDAVAQTAERHTLRGEGAALYHVVGRLRVVAGTGRDVVVDVVRQGREAAQTIVEQGQIGGRETLRIFPRGDRVIYPGLGRGDVVRTELRRDGTFGGESTRRGFLGTQVFSRGNAVGLEIRGDGRGIETWADVTVSVPAGGRLDVHLLAGEASVVNVDGDLVVDVHAASVTTERTRGRLRVNAGSGPVRVTDAQGELDLDTGSGRVELARVKAASLRVDAGSGAVRGADVDAERIDLDLGSGSVRLDGVRARTLRMDTGSGNVDVGLTSGVEDVRIDTGSGSVTLRVPADFGATLDIDGGSGGIESELPITVTRRERDRLTGRIGDGSGRVVIETGSGGVRLRRS
ncbi:MAG: DUF4097 family beta strand repeat-containing protein [Gemmatirosa sp.]